MAPAKRGQNTIVTYSIMTGLTALIPLPFVDELAKNYFKRRMTRALAAKHSIKISTQDVKILANEKSGCLSGCLLGLVIYPLKWVFRKIFFFLEWKRAVDIATRTYYQGMLIDHALERGYAREPARTRQALERVLKQVNTSVINRAMKESFARSKNVLWGAARSLGKSLGRLTRRSTPEQVEQVIDSVEAGEEREIAGVAEGLEQRIDALPPEHFAQVRALLDKAMGA